MYGVTGLRGATRGEPEDETVEEVLCPDDDPTFDPFSPLGIAVDCNGMTVAVRGNELTRSFSFLPKLDDNASVGYGDLSILSSCTTC